MKNIFCLIVLALLIAACSPLKPVPTQTQVPTQTITPLPSATSTPSPTPTIIPTPTQIGGGAGKLIFEYYKAAYEKAFPDLQGDVNVFTSNIDGTDLTPITNGIDNINQIASISPDGQMAIVFSRSDYSAKGDLYLINLNSPNSSPRKLAKGLIGFSGAGLGLLGYGGFGQAIFLDNTRIVYIGQGSEGNGIYVVNIDGSNPKKIGALIDRAQRRIVSFDNTRVYWDTLQSETFSNNSGFVYLFGNIDTLWWTDLDGSAQGMLESNGQQIMSDFYSFSPDGKSIAWIPEGLEKGCTASVGSLSPWSDVWSQWLRNGNQSVNNQTAVDSFIKNCLILHVASLSDMNNDTKILLTPPFDPAKEDFRYHKDYILTWWPDSSKILAYDNGFSSIEVVKNYPQTIYEILPKDITPKLILLKVLDNSPIIEPGGHYAPSPEDLFFPFNFSPDGRQILLTQHSLDNQGSIVNILNLESMDYVKDFANNITPDVKVQRVGNIYWLP